MKQSTLLLFMAALLLLVGAPAELLAHGVALGDKGHIQCVIGGAVSRV